MFRKYEKTYRISIPQFNVPGKHVLSKKDVKSLLGGKVTVEEKMDGANVGIIRHKSGFALQKRGSLVGESEHEQFSFFNNWANSRNYDKIMSVPSGNITYGELMYAIHTIYYDSLPDYFLVFDVWNGKKYLPRKERDVFCEKHGFHQVPLVDEGYFYLDDLYKLIPDRSKYGEVAEGIVVKRCSKKNYMRGKIVKKEFIKTLENSKHWIRYNIKTNTLQ